MELAHTYNCRGASYPPSFISSTSYVLLVAPYSSTSWQGGARVEVEPRTFGRLSQLPLPSGIFFSSSTAASAESGCLKPHSMASHHSTSPSYYHHPVLTGPAPSRDLHHISLAADNPYEMQLLAVIDLRPKATLSLLQIRHAVI